MSSLRASRPVSPEPDPRPALIAVPSLEEAPDPNGMWVRFRAWTAQKAERRRERREVYRWLRQFPPEDGRATGARC
jgi:hypothetical protein